ncbi:FAD-dependent pyridine nucleotide-disulphide oxidoreductase [Burkholderia sp. H160]|nr:FAD-dependent pyridine nucleotide-disulphide oxidoreductase [Burkholderia sp. H160]
MDRRHPGVRLTKLAGAETVTIAGAGPVGIELAGEIAVAWPKKKVRLASASDTLLPAYPARLGASLARQLKAMRVELALGERVSGLGGLDCPRLTPSGREILFPAVGTRPVLPPIGDLRISQTAWLNRTLKALVAGHDLAGLRTYAPSDAPALFMPLGPQAGAGVLPVTRTGWLVGPRLTLTAPRERTPQGFQLTRRSEIRP